VAQRNSWHHGVGGGVAAQCWRFIKSIVESGVMKPPRPQRTGRETPSGFVKPPPLTGGYETPVGETAEAKRPGKRVITKRLLCGRNPPPPRPNGPGNSPPHDPLPPLSCPGFLLEKVCAPFSQLRPPRSHVRRWSTSNHRN
jgi:hypothetical protein